MAHYALLDENNIVINIIVGRNEDEVVDGISDWETHYAEETGLGCKRTSYNTYRNWNYVWDDATEPPTLVDKIYLGSAHQAGGTPFRGQYANIGDIYDAELDEFITPTN